MDNLICIQHNTYLQSRPNYRALFSSHFFIQAVAGWLESPKGPKMQALFPIVMAPLAVRNVASAC